MLSSPRIPDQDHWALFCLELYGIVPVADGFDNLRALSAGEMEMYVRDRAKRIGHRAEGLKRNLFIFF